MSTKICTRCGIKKEFSEFNKLKKRKDGHRSTCRECDHERGKIYRIKHLEQVRAKGREHYYENRDKVLQYQHDHKEEANARKYKWSANNVEKRKEICRRYYETHKEQIKEYYRNNREECNRKRVEYNTAHPQARIAHNLRTAMWRILTGRSKGGRMLGLIGCEWNFFLKHIESQFIEGMQWSNYGNKIGMWCVDHIKPLISFNLTDIEQQRLAFNWQNCRPMWLTENASKSAWYNGIDYKKKKSKK
jgi:hypothetical protein